jgi:2,5-dioxopentanoate dehydrogenase
VAHSEELKGLSLIGWSTGVEGGSKSWATNPATGARLEPAYISAQPEEVERAAQLATAAFAAYRLLDGKRRGEFLRAIAANIDAIVDQIAIRMPQETGLPEARARSEAGRTSGQLRLFAAVVEEGSWVNARIDRADPNRKPLPKPDIRSFWRGLGPVAVFASSNFPLAFSVAGGDTASALAAGNPVIVKAHAAHPGTSELVGRAVQRAARDTNMPEGVFSLLFGPGSEVGAALVTHPLVKAVGFTGSLRGGRALMDLAAARPEPIPVHTEMSSTNPVFVLPGALRERAANIASGLVASVTLGAGQFCTKPGLVFVPTGQEAQRFTEEVGKHISSVAAAPLLTRQIQSSYKELVSERAAGGTATLVAEGAAPQQASGMHVRAALFETGADKFRDAAPLSEEIFGPETLIVHCDAPQDLLRIARELHGHLTATIHGTEEDLRQNRELVEILTTKVGRLIFNGYPTGVEVCYAMVHGGPYPATSDSRTTSVGTQAIYRFARPVCYQAFPDVALPAELQNANPLGIWRMVDGEMTRDAIREAVVQAQGAD